MTAWAGRQEIARRGRPASAPARRAAPRATPSRRCRRPRTPTGEKIGRNDPCYCGSGKKYKKCHYLQQG